ncbi:MAG: hypothetical protein ABSB60_14100 [Terracidiphilus sp.]|jgi:hypothetical protein
MKMTVVLIAAILAAMPANARAQTLKKGSTLVIAGQSGEAQLFVIDGKSYVDIESLARLTKGTLSFKANQTILTLNAANSEPPPPAKPALSRAFIQASIEELSVIREWQSAIVNAVETNVPMAGDWIDSHHRLAEKNLALASAAASTEDDHSAFPLLSAEFNNMQKLSDLYLAFQGQHEIVSPEGFGNRTLEDQIQSCAQSYASMIEGHQFQDQPACR